MGADAQRARVWMSTQPSLALRLAILAASLVVLALFAVIIIPAAIIFVIVLLAGGLLIRARESVARLLRRGRDTDGRENVKVILRDQPR